MELKTERLLLRAFNSEDLQEVFTIYKDEDTCKYLLHDKWTEENKKRNSIRKLKIVHSQKKQP